jgi:hypothetical protein
MNKFGIVAAVMLVLFAASAFAVADITYVFNSNNVQGLAYNCADAGCNTPATFSGSFPNGASTTNGQMLVRYPTHLQSANGYMLFFVSPGYIPKEGVATWWGNGAAQRQLDFEKVPVCSSVIDTFTVTNDAHANVPLVVRMSASLDAITRSAFSLTTTGVGYVPPELKDVYYSADTRVTLTIYGGNGAVVNQQTQDLTAANGNPLFAGENRAVEFSWTPSTDGVYRAVITTTVLDDQCASQVPQSSSSQFNVLPALPQNQCYTILNGLAANPFVGTVGQGVSLTFNKITNHANNYAFNGDPNYALTPVPTSISWTVTGPVGVVATSGFTAGANADNYIPSVQTFGFTPAQSGMHTVSVTGLASSAACAGLLNIPNTVTLNVNVIEPPRYNIRFHVINANGAPLDGVTITVAGQTLTTDAGGAATATSVAPGDYTYTAGKTDYISQGGLVHLVDTDADMYLTLQVDPNGNTGKVIFEVHNSLTQANIQGAVISFRGLTGTTDIDGMVMFNNAPAGDHAWGAAATGYNPASGTVSTNGHDDQQVYVALTPTNDGGPRTATVHVYDAATGANLPGASVTLTGPNSPPNGWTIATDGNGNAVFASIPQGSYSWFVSLAGYDPAQGGVNVIQDVTVQVALTRNIVPDTHSVTYHVIDATSGASLSGAGVVFNGVPLTTDANGNVVYTQVADGTYNFGVTLGGYLPASGTTQVTGADVVVVVPLTRVGTVHQVTFHVTDGNTGINLPGVAVVFDGRSGTTDNGGQIVFNNVPDTTYNYTATLNGYNPASGSFTVNGADVTVNVLMYVMTGNNTVTVHVYDAVTTANLPGAFVRFDGQQGSTDVAGNIVFSNVPTGSFPWDVTLVNYDPAAGTSTVNGNLVLQVPLNPQIVPPTHTVTVLVRDASTSQPIAGAVVSAFATQGTTNVFGETAFSPVADGTYSFNVAASSYNTANGIVTVAGSDVYIIVELSRTRPAPQPEEPQMGLFVGSIRIPEINTQTGEVPIMVTFKNDGETNLDGVKLAVVSTELGLRGSVGKFDLGRNDQMTKKVMFRLEDTNPEPGLYSLRITISNDDTVRVVYRDLEVLP